MDCSSALTIDNYEYIVDFIFHQNGAIETRFLSTGYILASSYRESDRPYGFRLADNLNGNVHHHMAHSKLDLDILGTMIRFETIEVVGHEIPHPKNSIEKIPTMRLHRELKRLELEVVYDYDFDRLTSLLVHNDKYRRENNTIQGYRLQTSSVSKQYVPEGVNNERSISWARHQVVVTKHKDDEFSPSSNYAKFDGADPVVDFSNFYKDDDNIVDEDLVLWITCGMHHIPHTEDLSVTPSVGNHLYFFILPYNYFNSTPSMHSHDTVYGGNKNINHSKREAPIDIGGTRGQDRTLRGQCLTPPITLEEDVEKNPRTSDFTQRLC